MQLQVNRIEDVKKIVVSALATNGTYKFWSDLERDCYDDLIASTNLVNVITSTNIVSEAARQLIQDKLLTYTDGTYRLTPLNVAQLKKRGLL